MPALLVDAAGFVALALEAISVLFVAVGGIEALYRVLRSSLRRLSRKRHAARYG